MEGNNQPVTPEECEFIRGLKDFDMIMLISEIHDHGWIGGGKTLIPEMRAAFERTASKDSK